MFTIIGILVVFGAVMGGYLMEHGIVKVLMQPAKLLIIGGAGLGTVLIANPLHILKKIVAGVAGMFGGSKFTKKRYLDTLKTLYELLNKARREGLMALESDVEAPAKLDGKHLMQFHKMKRHQQWQLGGSVLERKHWITPLSGQRRRNLLFMFIDDSTKLLVGFATRVEHSVVQGVERMLGCAVAPCFVTMSDFRARMQAFSSMRPATERIFDQIAAPLEMAQTVKDSVLQVGASEVCVALCREYLWVRILGASEPPDLLFKLESPTKDQPSAE
jgi:hypothetical protein